MASDDELYEHLRYDIRIDGECTIRYYGPDGYLHREGGPAIIRRDGAHAYCWRGFLHRLDGPAVRLSDGTLLWYLNGQSYSEEAHAGAVAMSADTGVVQDD